MLGMGDSVRAQKMNGVKCNSRHESAFSLYFKRYVLADIRVCIFTLYFTETLT